MVAYVKFTQYTRYHARLWRAVGDFGMPWLPGVNRARSSAKWKLVSLVFSYLVGRIGSVSHWSLYPSHWLYYYWLWLDRWNFGPGRWRCSHIWTARCIARRSATVVPVRCSQKPLWNRCGLLWVVYDIFAAALWCYVNRRSVSKPTDLRLFIHRTRLALEQCTAQHLARNGQQRDTLPVVTVPKVSILGQRPDDPTSPVCRTIRALPDQIKKVGETVHNNLLTFAFSILVLRHFIKSQCRVLFKALDCFVNVGLSRLK